MDLSNRGSQPHPAAPNVQSTNSFGPVNTNTNRKSKGPIDQGKLFHLTQGILMLAVVIVLIGLLVFLAFGGPNDNESKYVQTSKLQAVFLNTGQVYFGNIKTLNNSYFVLDNIFYLQTSSAGSSTTSTSSNTSVSLVKLGCELHAPLDQMVINRAQVTFWENLSPSGQVAKAVATFDKQNPNGQKCSDQSTAGTSGTNTPQNATDTTGSGTSNTKQ
jgi:FlaG/FlaF family flagellin (archaellin)